MKLVHAADLHLDSPLRGLSKYEGAPVDEIRGATRRALENLVALCLEEEVALLLIAGDLYDGDWRDYSTGLFFASQMSLLREAGVRVVWIRGNHDAESQITRHLVLPDNVHELPVKKPGTWVDESLGVAVHGQGFATRSVTEDLTHAYPDPRKGLLNIGLLHTSASGRDGHAPYAPCQVEALVHKGYAYWALGHVHAREVLAEEPWVVFSGNLQGRHIRESGPKGATLISVDDGVITEVAHQTLDAVRWSRVTVDAGGVDHADDVVDLVRVGLEEAVREAEGRTVAARVRVEGPSRAHGALVTEPDRFAASIEAVANDLSGEGVWVEKVLFRTRSPGPTAVDVVGEDVVARIVSRLRAMQGDPEALALLRDDLRSLRNKLPREILIDEHGAALDEPDALREALEDVERMLVPRLVGGGGA